jgi:uncharacterized protein YeaO (DUF488 family)
MSLDRPAARRVRDGGCAGDDAVAHTITTSRERIPGRRLSIMGVHPDGRQEFVRRYRAELGQDDHTAALTRLRSLREESPVTLLTATKDLSLSQVTVLADELG